jgi:hypothetical protein
MYEHDRHVEIDNFCAKRTDKKIAKYNQNKGNAKRGVSPCLTIWPCDLDLWPWKSIGFQILLRTKYVPSLVKIHWRMLILECSQGCYMAYLYSNELLIEKILWRQRKVIYKLYNVSVDDIIWLIHQAYSDWCQMLASSVTKCNKFALNGLSNRWVMISELTY